MSGFIFGFRYIGFRVFMQEVCCVLVVFTIVQGIRMHRRLLITVLLAGLAFAHPLGNFSVSRYSKLEMTATGARILYVLDLAEIPSFELLQKWGVKPGNAIAAVNEHAAAEAKQWMENLSVKIDGRPAPLKLEDARLSMSDGAGNMPVVRVEIDAVVEGGPGKSGVCRWQLCG